MDGRQELAGIFSTGPGGPLAARFVGISQLLKPRYPCQPSGTTLVPWATWSFTKACSEAADSSATGAIRHRPNPRVHPWRVRLPPAAEISL